MNTNEAMNVRANDNKANVRTRSKATAYWPLISAARIQEATERMTPSAQDSITREAFALDAALFSWRESLRARGLRPDAQRHVDVMNAWINKAIRPTE